MLTIRLGFFVYALVLTICTPALADIRATYINKNNVHQTRTVETSDSGAMRVSNKSGIVRGCFLFLDGQAYMVVAGPGGPIVTTIEAAAEQYKRYYAKSIVLGGNPDETVGARPIHYVHKGSTQIAGYDGLLFDFPDTYDPEYTQAVLSKNPALLPLGQAIAKYNLATDAISYWGGETTSNLGQLLSEHGVLSLYGYELKSISFEPLDQSRFVLPTTPLTLDDLEVETLGPDPLASTKENAAQSFVIAAQFYGNILYTLVSDGRLQAWQEGAESGEDVQVPGFVRDFCTHGDDFFLIVSEQANGLIRVWERRLGGWSIVAEFTESEPFLKLDCTGSQPIVISGTEIRFLNENRTNAISSYGLGAVSSTLQHNGFLYLGINAGEFGGGLHRFSITGGEGRSIGDSGQRENCEGILNASCHPVTDLMIDPTHPDCILATTGLVHFFSSGSVVRICGETIHFVYSKPYTLDPNWKFDPDRAVETYASVAFYSLGSVVGGTRAVGSDGIYRFSKQVEPDFTPFPHPFNFPKSGVDWSNPEFVLVLTTMNQRYSVSGASLILATR